MAVEGLLFVFATKIKKKVYIYANEVYIGIPYFYKEGSLLAYVLLRRLFKKGIAISALSNTKKLFLKMQKYTLCFIKF